MNEKINSEELALLRSYFSYNIRTSTAVIVASVTVLQLGLDEEDSMMTDSIIEAAYFLDIYDKGMEICFDYAMGKELPKTNDEIQPAKVVTHFISKIPTLIKENDITLDMNLNEYQIKNNARIIKIILETILCEIFNSSSGKISISANENVFSFKLPKPLQNKDKIFAVLHRYLKLLKIDLIVNANEITLQFAE